MRKIIISLLINIISWLSRNSRNEENANLCRIKADDRYLFVVMPDGKMIPGQLDLTVVQPFKLKGLAVVKCTFYVKFDNLIEK